MQTQPLSNCVLRASDYQRTRQRKMGIANKLAKAFDNYLAKEGCLEDPFQNKSSGTINPAYLPLELLNNTKNVPIKKHCLSQLLPNIFILQLGRNIPLTTMTSIELRLLLLYHSKGEMLRREQAKGHRKGTRAWQNDIQSL